jgi:hypothetical protein
LNNKLSSLDDLKALQEIDNIDLIKSKIKEIILSDQNLFKMIYYSDSNPLDKEYPENPFEIFEEQTQDNQHGVILFKEKDYTILNTECVNILVYFSSETFDNTKSISTIYVNFNIVLKGENIQTLSDDSSRTYKISKLIDNQFNHAEIPGVGEINKEFLKKETISDENSFYHLSYKCKISSYSDQIKIYIHQSKEDEWGITRESYSLLSTPTNPIIFPMKNLYSELDSGTFKLLATAIDSATLVDIQPCTDEKVKQDYGYSISSKRRMICDIVPEIDESTVVKYNDVYYTIEKIIKYDDYLDCSLVETWDIVIDS